MRISTFSLCVKSNFPVPLVKGVSVPGYNPCRNKLESVFNCVGPKVTDCFAGLYNLGVDLEYSTCVDYFGSEFVTDIFTCMDVVESYNYCEPEARAAERCISDCVSPDNMPCRDKVNDVFNCLGPEVTQCFEGYTRLGIEFATCNDLDGKLSYWISVCMDRFGSDHYDCAVEAADKCVADCATVDGTLMLSE